MEKWIVIAVLLFSPQASACESFHLLTRSFHFGTATDFNEQNYGALIECSRIGFGGFRNSDDTDSAIAYYKFPLTEGRYFRAGLNVGAITGYRNIDVAPVLALDASVYVSKSIGVTAIAFPGIEYGENDNKTLIGVVALALSIDLS